MQTSTPVHKGRTQHNSTTCAYLTNALAYYSALDAPPNCVHTIRQPATHVAPSPPLSSSLIWGPLEAPPYTQQVRIPQGLPKVLDTPSTCWASSRVGARTRSYEGTPHTYCSNCTYVYITDYSIDKSATRYTGEPTMGPSPLLSLGWLRRWIKPGRMNCIRKAQG